MRKGLVPGLAILAALVSGSTAPAIEPDGRVAFRYSWPDRKEGAVDAPRLTLSVTAVTPLRDARLIARIPSGVGLSLRDGLAEGSWPGSGLAIGDLAAGQTVVVELDVAKPPQGGGILGFVLQATAEGRVVSEGVGVTVGTPGTAPTSRNGAAEFPASSPDPVR